MKQITKSILLIFVFFVHASAQVTWEWQNPKPQGNDLRDVQVIDDITVVAVGNAGTFIRSPDAGLTWDVVHNIGGFFEDLYDIFFRDANTGWAVGYEDIILKTTNGGQDWVNHGSGGYEDWDSVFFINDMTGWIGGGYGKLLKTTDGGGVWNEINIGSQMLHEIWFEDAQEGWAIRQYFDYGSEYYGVSKTTDGGETWSNSSDDKSDAIFSVSFGDSNNGWAVGETGFMIVTTDGGSSWAEQDLHITNDMNSVYFRDASTGWIVCEEGLILTTTNGGATWQVQAIDSSNELMSVDFVNTQTGWAVGENGVLLKTSDAGTTWDRISTAVYQGSINDVHFVDDNLGWAIGVDGTILRTTDGGLNWFSTDTDLSFSFWNLYFHDENLGWAVGDGVHHTTDGGFSWTAQAGSPLSFYAVDFIDSLTGWTVGEQGAIRKTTDGGLLWETVYLGISSPLDDVQFINSNTGWISGVPLLRTLDGGGTWEIVNNIPMIEHMSFIDTQTGWATSGRKIIKSTDGGFNWTDQYMAQNYLEAVSFIDENIGWAAGRNGVIVYTTDGGVVWEEEDFLDNSLYGLHTFRSDLIWVVGDGGMILKGKVDPFSIVQDCSESPVETFQLEQNYPNPFNASTTIDFSISNPAFVSLKIYDLRGRQVDKLVEGVQQKGKYEVYWDAGPLPSGIYVYRLEADSHVETRKMILQR